MISVVLYLQYLAVQPQLFITAVFEFPARPVPNRFLGPCITIAHLTALILCLPVVFTNVHCCALRSVSKKRF